MSRPDTASSALDGIEVPRHVAIIMDGNGRWAAARGLPRGEGTSPRRRGVAADGARGRRSRHRGADDFFLQLGKLVAAGVRNSRSDGSAQAFRPATISPICIENGVRVRIIGERDDLDADIRRLLEEAEELTKGNDRLTLVVAFNYGARQEIARAVRRMAEQSAAGALDPSTINAETARRISRHGRPAGSGPDHPHQRRAALVEFSVVAGGLQRTRVSSPSTGRISIAPRSKARSPNIAGANAGSAVSLRNRARDDAEPKPATMPRICRRQDRPSRNLCLRVSRRPCWRRSRSASPISAVGPSPLFWTAAADRGVVGMDEARASRRPSGRAGDGSLRARHSGLAGR